MLSPSKSRQKADEKNQRQQNKLISLKFLVVIDTRAFYQLYIVIFQRVLCL